MRTAKQVRQSLVSNSENMKEFDRLVKNAIEKNFTSFTTEVDFTRFEMGVIEENGFSITYNFRTKRYLVNFSGY